MLSISKPSENRIDIALSGHISADTMREGLDGLIAQSQGITHGQMLYTITDFALPSLGAIGVEMARLPQLFGLLGKFDKCAVLCDTAWIRKAAEVEGALFPGITIQSFELHDTEAAEAWLNA